MHSLTPGSIEPSLILKIMFPRTGKYFPGYDLSCMSISISKADLRNTVPFLCSLVV